MRLDRIAVACLLTLAGSRCGTVPADGRLAGRRERPRLHAVFRAGSDQPRERRAAQAGLDVPHGRARGPQGQDDRMHADRGRRRDVRHHRISPRRGPRRRDRQGALAVRPPQGSSVRAPAGVGRRQPGLRLLVRRQARRRAADHPRDVGRAAVLARREDRQARPEVRRRGHPRPPQGARPEGRPRSATGRRPPRPSGRTRSSSASPAARGRASPRRGTSGRSTSARASEVWRFRTVPGPGEFGNETWEGDSWKDRGGANAWGGFSVDADRGLVFAGLGSAAFDFYGGDRHGDNLFANCTIALDARTGKRVWHFQTLHHDLWDHDLPVYPEPRHRHARRQAGRRRRAGDEDGLRLPVRPRDGQAALRRRGAARARPPTSPASGPSPTQPIPVKPPPFSAQFLDETNVTDIGAANRASVLARLRKIRGGPAFNPPSLQGTVVIPGFHGGANWSGASFDPTTGLLYVNSNNVPNIITLVESKAGDTAEVRALRAHGLRPVPRPRGLPGDQAALGGA